MKIKKQIIYCCFFLAVLIGVTRAANITVNAATTLLTIPSEVYGTNMAPWTGSNNGSDQAYVTAMQVSGSRNIRWPGGSWADILNWDDIECHASYDVTTPEFVSFLQDFGAVMHPICNFSGYWCSTQYTHAQAVSLAASWVTWNMTNAGSARAKYFDIGNENYGNWEQGGQGATGSTLTAAIYGQYFADYYTAMKAIDATILIGAVAAPSATSYSDWTPNMLTAAKAAGVVPDYLIVHNYPGPYPNTGTAADATSLNNINLVEEQTTSLNNVISNTLGSSYVGQIKYYMDEYNINNGPSALTNEYINAMFCAQWIMEAAKNGWIGCNLWAAKNGAGSNGFDFGFLNAADVPFPNYYVFPMLSGKFGTNMVSCSSDDTDVRAYAAEDASGNLTLFMVNNSATASNSTNISISGFTPAATGLAWVMLPQGTPASGAPQEAPGIQINGNVNPAPNSISSIAGQSTDAGSSFSVTLQPSEMLLMVIPFSTIPVSTNTITPTCTQTPVVSPTPTPNPSLPRIYPNPVKDNFNYAFNLSEDSNVEIDIYTFALRLIAKFNQNQGAGQHIMPIDTVQSMNLANGTYYILYKQKGQTTSTRRIDPFIVLR